MKKFLLICSLFLLTACFGPNESDFKSDVPYSSSGCGPSGGSYCGPDSGVGTTIGSTTESAKSSDGQQSGQQSAINWNVTFFSQAPDGDWGMPWQEACEEAASTLAYYYVSGQTLTKEQFKKDVKGLVAWQNKNLGDYKHSDVDQTAKMIREYFNYTHYKILKDPTIDQLKKEISNGNIIIAPFAGRQLKNPFYTGLGPLYHMMVIKGYDQKNFITNDVGTRRGHNFIYPQKTIMSALHDYNANDINKGTKKVIILYRQPFSSSTKPEK